jgi:hypothetical protein
MDTMVYCSISKQAVDPGPANFFSPEASLETPIEIPFRT